MCIRDSSQGGEDFLDNLQALCVCCHGEKSERERLGAVYPRPLYSQLNSTVLECLFDAPKPRQLVFGDGQDCCIEIDTIGCRVNALVKGYVPLPIANVMDDIQAYDQERDEITRADFYFIDAGETLDVRSGASCIQALIGTHERERLLFEPRGNQSPARSTVVTFNRASHAHNMHRPTL